MSEPLPDSGTIRKLWISETDAYRDHLLRLDQESRHRRFSGAVSDDFIARHAATANEMGVVVHGFFVDGVLRGAAELRRLGLAVHARGGSRLQRRTAVAEPRCRHRAARTHAALRAQSRHQRFAYALRRRQSAHAATGAQVPADLTFDFGSVVGEVDAARSTPLSLMREAMADADGVANAMLDAQSRLFGPA